MPIKYAKKNVNGDNFAVIYQTDNKKILTKFYKGLRTSYLEVIFVTDSSIYFKASLIVSALLSALVFQI